MISTGRPDPGEVSVESVTAASLVLYFAVTYTIQRLILQAKAQRIAGAPRQDVGDPGTHAPSW